MVSSLGYDSWMANILLLFLLKYKKYFMPKYNKHTTICTEFGGNHSCGRRVLYYSYNEFRVITINNYNQSINKSESQLN